MKLNSKKFDYSLIFMIRITKTFYIPIEIN